MCKNHFLYVFFNCKDTSQKSCSGCKLLFCTKKGYCYLYDKCNNDMSFFCELCVFWVCCCNCCEGCGGMFDTNSYSKIDEPETQTIESSSESITYPYENSKYGSNIDTSLSLFMETVTIT